MPNRDFIDQDLYAPRDEVPRVKMGPGDEPPPPHADGLGLESGRSVSDLNLPLMVRHRHALDQQAAQQAQEVERLRQLQEEIERERREVEEARRIQEDFVKGRRELLDRLAQSLVTVERHETKATQLAELMKATRLQFRAMLDDINAIREDEWTEETIRDRLREALARIDDARVEYNKAVARVEAAIAADGKLSEAPALPYEAPAPRPPPAVERSLGQWFLVGLMASLPAILTAIGILLVVLFRGAAGF